ncbi:hypothetical protein GCM10010121_091330 [Streptomyces brasiliensis]|uniref:Uncharacterized protein n=1 Tax=Streptomyces brasiliensis TaxID=1954 RepID=A0A917P869_9ACTN|nr:hypothetical protein GCM10010121_091330 [Streptomyces brasiliensis]
MQTLRKTPPDRAVNGADSVVRTQSRAQEAPSDTTIRPDAASRAENQVGTRSPQPPAIAWLRPNINQRNSAQTWCTSCPNISQPLRS